MDATSYSYADKQAKRIKKFINDPDSTSGVLTVPKVIASGESVTIPAGRVAILPDVQVDGTLNVLGDIFIPSGTANSKVVQKVTSTDKAIPRFNGTTGDIQNSGVIIDDNGNVGIGVTPSAWYPLNVKALDIGTSTSLWNWSGETRLFNNSYMDGSGTYRYKNNGYAGWYNIDNGSGAHRWLTAPTGTAGNAITWTNAMALNGNSLSLGNGTANIGSQLNCYGFDSSTNNFEFVQRTANKGFNWYVNAGSIIAMTLGANGNLLVGTSTDNGVDKLQVDGSINCNNKIVYQNSIIGTFTGDVWYDTGVTTNTLGYNNILDTFAITIYEDSYLTGNSNYQMLYKFIVGSTTNSSNSGNTFDIPTLSAVGHAHNGGSVSLRWQHLYSSQSQKIQFKVTYTSTFNDSIGKSLKMYVTKLI